MSRSRIHVPPFAPMGLLLERYLEGQRDASLEVHLEDGEVDLLFGSDLFRTDGFAETDELALAMCQGRVLDVGAAAGSHCLDLAARGIEATALDSEPGAVRVLRARGVERVVECDVFELQPGSEEERFDTVLFLMNGFGVAGDLDGLARLLLHCHHLVTARGALLADVSDLERSPDRSEARRILRRREQGRYAGEAILRMELESNDDRLIGAPFPWLYLAPDTLTEVAERTGWATQVVFEDGDGDALLRLVRS